MTPPSMDAQPPAARKPFPALKAALWLALLGVAAGLYVVFQALSKPDPDGYGAYARGPMQAFIAAHAAPAQPTRTVLAANGAPVRLSDFRGQVLLVNLWATWCAPCVEEMPTLGRLQAAFAGEDLTVMAISVDSSPQDRAAAPGELARLSGGALAFYSDPSFAIAYDLRARGMPTTILYARDGREIGRLSGAADWASPEAAALIRAALAEAAPPVSGEQ